mmetsp:Transcript_74989/g.231913  ORF Transcript_74989/g.231913 Transcript_74989/m.231913 type:complete len:212 (-) Transcript_74989:565-1200(-)
MRFSSPHSVSAANLKRKRAFCSAWSHFKSRPPKPFPSPNAMSAWCQPSFSSVIAPSTSTPSQSSTFARSSPELPLVTRKVLSSGMRQWPSSSQRLRSDVMTKACWSCASSGRHSFMLPTKSSGSRTSIFGFAFLSSNFHAKASSILGSTLESCCFFSSDMSLYRVRAAWASACHFFRAFSSGLKSRAGRLYIKILDMNFSRSWRKSGSWGW